MKAASTYAYLERARQKLLDWVRPLPEGDYTREFPFGLRTLARTLTHIAASEWYYVLRIAQGDVPPYAEWPMRDEQPPPFAVLESTWRQQAERTRAVIVEVRDWDAEIEYRITDDDGKPQIITASRDEIFTQLVLHEVHHRAQAMAMLRQLGIAAEELDFNLMTYRRRPA